MIASITRKTCLLLIFICSCLHSDHEFHQNNLRKLQNWPKNRTAILQPTSSTPSRTAVLIIAPPKMDGADYTHNRWKLGKKVWEQYMNTVANVDCYFIQSTHRKDKNNSEEVWCEGNTIYIGDSWYENYENDRILHKTIAAIEFLLPNYTHFIRTNLNSFFNLEAVRDYTESHHQSMYTGPLWQGEWYVLGYGILFTEDVADHICSEYRRLEGSSIVSCYRADDAVLTSLATGIYPENPSEHVFSCCPSLPLGVRQLMSWDSLSTKRIGRYGMLLLPPISLTDAIQYIDRASNSVILYRIREGFTLPELAEVYERLLQKIYPNVESIKLIEYVESL